LHTSIKTKKINKINLLILGGIKLKMTTLSQLLAVETQIKSSSHDQLTEQHHLVQKDPLLNGISRTYQTTDDEGERLPPENTLVQVRVKEVLKNVVRVLTPYYNISLEKDSANQLATANVEVDGKIILQGVPATYLLWLEKQLIELHTFLVKLPTLPQTESWSFDEGQNTYRSAEVKTAKTKKIARPFIKYEATKEHPAQVDIVHDDKLVGYWSTTKFSGAIPRQTVQELRERIEKLQAAVKTAREAANMVKVPAVEAGSKIFGYLFEGI
jgi:hypothetical protein